MLCAGLLLLPAARSHHSPPLSRQAVTHFTEHAVAHLDLKLDNILVADDGRLVVCDFGTAVRFRDSSMTLDYTPGMAVGGNQMHLAPEVLNAFAECSRRAGGGGTISYAAQGVWAVGVVAYEMAMGHGPWPDYPADCGGSGSIAYDTADVPTLGGEYVLQAPHPARCGVADSFPLLCTAATRRHSGIF